MLTSMLHTPHLVSGRHRRRNAKKSKKRRTLFRRAALSEYLAPASGADLTFFLKVLAK